MIGRILVALDDSAAALAAARFSISLAHDLGARLRVMHVAVDHELGEALRRVTAEPDVQQRIASGRHALLARAAALASASGVDVETVLMGGDVAPAILAAATAWDADLVVVGRSARTGRGVPYVGSQARQLLEFTDRPVLVIPPPPTSEPRG